MKKILCSMVALTMLSGCWYTTDYSEERAENRALKKSIEGCTFYDDHEAYRDCIIKTQLRNSPKTYTTDELDDASPVAVIRGAKVRERKNNVYVIIEKVEVLTPTVPVTETVETKVETKPVVVEKPKAEKTWWETYQENRPVPKQAACPCDDPNIACPECYNK